MTLSRVSQEIQMFSWSTPTRRHILNISLLTNDPIIDTELPLPSNFRLINSIFLQVIYKKEYFVYSL